MTDLLVRDVPEHVVAAIDAKAKRLGLSRNEYLRRQISQAVSGEAGPVTVEDLRAFATTFADLDDPGVMTRAWQ